GLTIDRKARTVNRWWGVWNPWGNAFSNEGVPANVRVLSRPRPCHLSDRTEIVIGRKVRKASNEDREQIVYPVRLECQPPLVLAECVDELEARHLSEEVARFLGLAIVDGSSGT